MCRISGFRVVCAFRCMGRHRVRASGAVAGMGFQGVGLEVGGFHDLSKYTVLVKGFHLS